MLEVRPVLALVTLVVLIVAGVLVVRAATVSSYQPTVEPAPAGPVDAYAAAERLAGALRYPTLSPPDPELGYAPYDSLRAYLEASFPRVHAELDREIVGGYSLLYTWPGRDAALEPVLLLAHLDVVPVEPGTEREWTHPPFGGRVADGYVWGRGALDHKSGVVGILEAVEVLLAEGFAPDRSVLLAFGHDEEIGGQEGAATIARRLEEQGRRMAFVLDEGGFVLHEGMALFPRPLAVVGVAEKGYVSLALEAEGTGGHSSAPPPETAAGIVARAVNRLQDQPFPTRMTHSTREMFGYLAPELSFGRRVVFANLWLFGPLVEWRMAAEPTTAAIVRTTTAPTMLQAGVKDNVLPTRAQAVVNFRILPGQRVEDVLARAERVIDDPRVHISVWDSFAQDPSPVSPTDAPAFERLAVVIRQTFPDVTVAPYLVIGATDARHYTGLSDHVYRFHPARLRPAELDGFHGIDERIGVEAYADAVRFYRRLVLEAAGPAGSQ